MVAVPDLVPEYRLDGKLNFWPFDGNSRIGKQTLHNFKLNITPTIVWTPMPREGIKYLSHDLLKVFCRDDDIANCVSKQFQITFYQKNIARSHHSIRSISFQYLVVLYCK